MYIEIDQLDRLIHYARQRRRLLLALRGLALCLASGAIILLLFGWAVYHYRYHDATVMSLRLAALGAVIANVYVLLIRPLARRITDARLARLIEEHAPG